MKILTNKEYAYLQKCREYYEKYRKAHQAHGKTEGARASRARYYAKTRKVQNARRAEQYRVAHPGARPYKPRKPTTGNLYNNYETKEA